MKRSTLIWPLLICLQLSMAMSPPDADREIVTVTADPNGDIRERRIWFARLDGALYIRTTARATWGANVLRDGSVTIVSRGERSAYTATRIDEADHQERIHQRFREKYGADDWWADRVRFFFGGKVSFRLTPL